jgi:hypothetical protein
MNNKQKYLKYKNKYLLLKQFYLNEGGGKTDSRQLLELNIPSNKNFSKYFTDNHIKKIKYLLTKDIQIDNIIKNIKDNSNENHITSLLDYIELFIKKKITPTNSIIFATKLTYINYLIKDTLFNFIINLLKEGIDENLIALYLTEGEEKNYTIDDFNAIKTIQLLVNRGISPKYSYLITNNIGKFLKSTKSEESIKFFELLKSNGKTEEEAYNIVYIKGCKIDINNKADLDKFFKLLNGNLLFDYTCSYFDRIKMENIDKLLYLKSINFLNTLFFKLDYTLYDDNHKDIDNMIMLKKEGFYDYISYICAKYLKEVHYIKEFIDKAKQYKNSYNDSLQEFYNIIKQINIVGFDLYEHPDEINKILEKERRIKA